MRDHAIEARICAENPASNFLPATGRLVVARWPAHVAFVRDDTRPRVDSGFGEGDAISPYYDSMIAKLIVWGEDRSQALARLDAALRDTHIAGLHTNVAFLRRVVRSPAFATADLDTALIERQRSILFDDPPLGQELPPEWMAAGVAAHVVADEARLEDADPWSRRDGWRLVGGARRQLHLQGRGQPLVVSIERHHDGATTLALGERRWAFVARGLGGGRHDVSLGDVRALLSVYAHGERFAVFGEGGSAQLAEHDPIAHAGDHAGDAGRLTAPMPGKVVAFQVRPGDRVRRGQTLAVMEAMKMEHTIAAPCDGVVEALLYAPGDQVVEGGELLRLAASTPG